MDSVSGAVTHTFWGVGRMNRILFLLVAVLVMAVSVSSAEPSQLRRNVQEYTDESMGAKKKKDKKKKDKKMAPKKKADKKMKMKEDKMKGKEKLKKVKTKGMDDKKKRKRKKKVTTYGEAPSMAPTCLECDDFGR